MKHKSSRREEKYADWRESFDDKVYSSVIAKRFRRFINWLYSFLINGFFGKIFTAYSAEEKKFFESRLVTAFQNAKTGRRIATGFRTTVSRAFEKSRILTAMSNMASSLLHMPLKTYAALLVALGGVGTTIYIIKVYALGVGVENPSVLLTCSVFLLSSLLLVMSKDTFAQAALKSRSMNVLLFEWLGLPRDAFMSEKIFPRRYGFFGVLGAILGGLVYFVHPLFFVAVAAVILMIFVVFSFPEIGVLGLIALVPLSALFSHPSVVLFGATVITGIGYCIKLMRGKRVVKLGLVDFAVLVFAAIVLLSGVFSAGGTASFSAAALYFVLIMGYFLTVNLIRTREWVRRCVITFVSVAAVTACFGVVQMFIGTMETAWLDTKVFSDIRMRITATFDNPNVYAAYLLLALPFVPAVMLGKDAPRNRRPLLFVFLLLVFCLIETWCRGAWLGALVSLLLFFLIYSRRSVAYILLGGALVPAASLLLPSNVVSRFTSIGSVSDSSAAYRISAWRGVGRMLGDHWIGGIGFGETAFSAVYPTFSYAGIEGIHHTHNLYLQILSEMGVAGLLALLFVLVLFVQNVFEYVYKMRNQGEAVVAVAGLMSVGASLIMGLTDYIWYSPRLFLMFWIVVALVNAYIRIGLVELGRSGSDNTSSMYSVNFDLNVDNL